MALDPKLHEKLFEITDELTKLKNNPGDLSKRAYENLLKRICGSFTDSLNNGLRDVIYQCRQAGHAEAEQVAAVFSDAASFAHFARFEQDVLIACGASETVAADVVRQFDALRSKLGKGEAIPPEDLVRAFEISTDQACTAAKHVEEGLSREQAAHLAKKRALIAGGAAVLVATGVAATAGAGALVFPPLYVTGSAIFGNLLLAAGFQQKDPLDKRPRKR